MLKRVHYKSDRCVWNQYSIMRPDGGVRRTFSLGCLRGGHPSKTQDPLGRLPSEGVTNPQELQKREGQATHVFTEHVQDPMPKWQAYLVQSCPSESTAVWGGAVDRHDKGSGPCKSCRT